VENPMKDDNAEKRHSSLGGNKAPETKAEKFTKSVNVRLVNYTHSTVMAAFIAFGTLVGFVVLLVAMMTACPVESTKIEKTVYNGGVLDMHMDFINKIVNPDNLAELQKQKNFKRTVDICIIRAAINVAIKQDSKTFSGDAENNGETSEVYMNHKQICRLPSDEEFQASAVSQPLMANLKWCEGMYKKNNPMHNDAIFCDDSFYTDKYGTIGRDFTVHFTYKIEESKEVCPTFTSALGSGLAYISYLEMTATLLVGFLLIKLGVAKPLNERASLMGLLKSANSDTSKVEDDIQGLRDDVDKIMHEQNDLDDEQTKRIESLEEKIASLSEAKN